ncbi:MAG: DUF1592 domain-containing protein [Mariniblastus sp.]|nr:DUF1592 domain-containing protein [Mariniblastus sp.]
MSLSTDVQTFPFPFIAVSGVGQRVTCSSTTFFVLLLLGAFSSILAQDSQERSPASLFEVNIQPTLKIHCVKCHGQMDVVEGDVNLVELLPDRLGEQVDLLSSLVDVLDRNEMPPEDEPSMDPRLRRRMVADLKTIVRNISASRADGLGTPIRRMNRFQYNNAITDLFDLKCNVFTLPERIMREHQQYFKPETGKMADVVAVGNRPLGKSQMIERRLAGVAAFPQDLRAEHGFDNQGDHLSMSPLLMESFLKLGQSITQSPDFTKRNVGIWKSFFSPPAAKRDASAEVRERLKRFLYRAFRRPVNAEVLNRYTQFVTSRLEAGVGFSEAMKSVAAATIASPRFLYLYDISPAVSPTESMNGFELASRLSFFLWGSIPDQVLLDLAASGELSDPQVVVAQIDRMLSDRKIKRFCDSFPAQWLQLDRIISSLPDPEKYPDFYFSKYRDSMHMMLEPLLLFETILIENLSITQLIDSDFTYRSPVLQQAYEDLGKQPLIGRKTGAAVGVLSYSRVPVKDRRNGGVITNAAVMTMTSGTDRTQPITRGAWVASVIFNDPPKPPPADVPPLDEKLSASEQQLTLRERLSAHRKQADCKGCHEQIDPLGFALENYDAIGVWREQYENGREVDSSGSLFRTHPFDDIFEFKDAILAEKHRFARALAGHLLAFGLARRVGPAEQAALDQIVEATIADDYKIQTLIKQVILSQPFYLRTDLTVPPDSDKLNVHPKR